MANGQVTNPDKSFNLFPGTKEIKAQVQHPNNGSLHFFLFSFKIT